MKYIILIVHVVFLLTSLNRGGMNAQSTLFNLDFEHWIDSTLTLDQAAFDEVGFMVEDPYLGQLYGWSGTQIHRTTDANNGNYAVVLNRWYNYADGFLSLGTCDIEHSTCRLPLDSKVRKVSGYYKYFITDADTLMNARAQMVMVISGFENGIYKDTIGRAVFHLLPKVEYTYFEATVDYNEADLQIDSFSLVFSSTGEIPSMYPLHNFLILDDLSFEWTTTETSTDPGLEKITLLPNPGVDKFMIRSDLKLPDRANVCLVDVLGVTVLENMTFNRDIDISGLAKGCYYVQFRNTLSNIPTMPLIKY
ncbi:MAG: T9SS type A sorting domain-containing protein [Saprospiraceae bacterium]|nr:T9SS type A sorting domain-containing protein [Saprospiraceae bacterium]